MLYAVVCGNNLERNSKNACHACLLTHHRSICGCAIKYSSGIKLQICYSNEDRLKIIHVIKFKFPFKCKFTFHYNEFLLFEFSHENCYVSLTNRMVYVN